MDTSDPRTQEVLKRYNEAVARGENPSYNLFQKYWYEVYGGYGGAYDSWLGSDLSEATTPYGTPTDTSTLPTFDTMPDVAPEGAFVVDGVTYNDPNRGVLNFSPYSITSNDPNQPTMIGDVVIAPPANHRIQNILDNPKQPGDPGYNAYQWALGTDYAKSLEGDDMPQSPGLTSGNDADEFGQQPVGGAGTGPGGGNSTTTAGGIPSLTEIQNQLAQSGQGTNALGGVFSPWTERAPSWFTEDPSGAFNNLLGIMGGSTQLNNPWVSYVMDTLAPGFPALNALLNNGEISGIVGSAEDYLRNLTSPLGTGNVLSKNDVANLLGGAMSGTINGVDGKTNQIVDALRMGTPNQVANTLLGLVNSAGAAGMGAIEKSVIGMKMQQLLRQYNNMAQMGGDSVMDFVDYLRGSDLFSTLGL